MVREDDVAIREELMFDEPKKNRIRQIIQNVEQIKRQLKKAYQRR